MLWWSLTDSSECLVLAGGLSHNVPFETRIQSPAAFATAARRDQRDMIRPQLEFPMKEPVVRDWLPQRRLRSRSA